MKSIAIMVLLLTGFNLRALPAESPAFRPPKGARVALVVFEDLQCPDCANASPLLEEAVRSYKIPLVRHDFPLQKHDWSRQAAILARYFDTKSKKLGDEFRDYCFKHQAGHEQPTITSPENLREHAERFAAAHKVRLPLIVDPQGKLEAKVQADYELGIASGVQHTPTIYVVSNRETGTPFVEVVDRTKLFNMIDDMLAQSKEPGSPAKSSRASKSKPKTSAQ
jgi:protein-disulfide isomerase